MEDLCERSRKLIHKKLRSQDLDTLTYKDIENISRNVHKARSSQLFPLPTDIEETRYFTVRILIFLFLYLYCKKKNRMRPASQ